MHLHLPSIAKLFNSTTTTTPTPIVSPPPAVINQRVVFLTAVALIVYTAAVVIVVLLNYLLFRRRADDDGATAEKNQEVLEMNAARLGYTLVSTDDLDDPVQRAASPSSTALVTSERLTGGDRV